MGALNQISFFTHRLSSPNPPPAPQGQARWFKSIPPERVGLGGEYDHYGLKKRVECHLRNCLGANAIADLTILQRGRVIILHGRVTSPTQLQQIVQIALMVEGIAQVELCGIEYVPTGLVSMGINPAFA
ncbi:BON domain-containing protein [Leptolyngbya sp. PCC 6406]|uniref:BON domain-containing protein n=1 Tax=Leptolyngbya sp. PCC 6406 TaxID=1173264 RepID=UPI0002AD17B2|nr:BON domain-containing protein [Leptolyngbya sp. PCC 6406]